MVTMSTQNIGLKQPAKAYRRQIFGFMSILVLILGMLVYRKSSPSSSPFEEFVKSTTPFNNINLPPSNEVVRYKVQCLRAANMVENSPAFPNGNRMSKYLENCGKVVADAENSLQAMYQHGNNLFTTFNIEIRDMVKTLRADTPMNIPAYLITRMVFLRTKVRGYQSEVAHAQDQVIEAEQAQHLAEKELFNGKRNGEKYLEDKKKDGESEAEVKSATEELDMVMKLLDQMHVVAQQLGQVNSYLIHYNDALLDIEAKIKDVGGVSERDIENLWQLGESLRALHEMGLKSMIGS